MIRKQTNFDTIRFKADCRKLKDKWGVSGTEIALATDTDRSTCVSFFVPAYKERSVSLHTVVAMAIFFNLRIDDYILENDVDSGT